MSTKHVNVSEGVRLSGLHSVSRRVHQCQEYITNSLSPKALVKLMYLNHQEQYLLTCWLFCCQGSEYLVSYGILWAGAKQSVHFLGGEVLGIQQGTSVWVGSPKLYFMFFLVTFWMTFMKK